MLDHFFAELGASVVVVAPHPDDETLAAGGLIQAAVARGAAVSVVMLTDGDNNPWPQRMLERRAHIAAPERARWGRRRRLEAAAALSVLGVATDHLHCLGWPDMELSERLIDSATANVDRLSALFKQLTPTIVVTPALRDRHPDHSAANVLTELGLQHAQLAPQRLSYIVHGARDVAASDLDLDQALLRRKLSAVEEHETQLVLSRGRMLGYARRPECFVLEPNPGLGTLCERYVLPWRIGAAVRSFTAILVATPAGTWRIPLGRRVDGNAPAAEGPRLDVTGRRITLELPASLRKSGPLFAKLAATVNSPWIYDHWGWIRLDDTIKASDPGAVHP